MDLKHKVEEVINRLDPQKTLCTKCNRYCYSDDGHRMFASPHDFICDHCSVKMLRLRMKKQKCKNTDKLIYNIKTNYIRIRKNIKNLFNMDDIHE